MDQIVERVQEKILVSGLYQKFLIIMTIFIGLSTFYLSAIIPLMQTPPPSVCYDSSDALKQIRICDESDLCNKSVIKTLKPNTTFYINWEIEFKVGCEKKQNYDYINGGMFTGCLISNLFLSNLSDVYGRRKVIVVENALTVIIMIAAFFATSIEFFIWWSTILSILNQVLIHHLVFLNESINQQLYSYVVSGIMLSFPIDFVIIGYLLSMYQNWKIVHFFFTIITLICLVLSYFGAETPAFYISTHNYKDFGLSCEYIARVNGDLSLIAKELDAIIGYLIT